jgi:superfamily II DNA or RNA helicase
MDIKVSEIIVKDKIYIKKDDISLQELQNNFVYPLDDAYATTLAEDGDFYTLGVGCLNRIRADKIIDQRITRKTNTQLNFTAKLHEAQQRTLDKFLAPDGNINSGIIKAKCGWGKSFWGTGLVCQVQEPTMILCHTKLLQSQWIELFKTCTDYSPGIVGDGIYDPKEITIGLYISVHNRIADLKDRYTRVIVDEVHRCGADLFGTTLNYFDAYYKNGMSATPTRRDGRHILFPDYFTDLFVEAEEYRNLIRPFVEIKRVPLRFDVLNPTRDWAKALTKAFGNEKYLDMIARDVVELISDGRAILCLAPRTEALRYLQKKIPRSIVLDGSVKKSEERDAILSKVGTEYDCVLTTTLFDEGISCHRLDTLVLTAPNGKNFGLLEQRIGRIQRELPEKQPALIRAYWLDNHILSKQQNIEYMWYNAQGYQTRLIS